MDRMEASFRGKIQITDNYIDEVDVSYSMCIDKKNEKRTVEPLRSTLPRKIQKWVDDKDVKFCYKCKTEFGFFLRKHHCRLCGKIFCDACSNYRDAIPKNLLSDDSKRGTWNDYVQSYISGIDIEKHRACLYCHEIIQKVNMVKKIVEVFNIMNLDVKDLKKIVSVCRSWNYASNYMLSIFREIQYKLPTDTYTEIEKQLLWTNSKYFCGHNRFIYHLYKICRNKEEVNIVDELYSKKKKEKCWAIMCSRNCIPKLTSIDAINIVTQCLSKGSCRELLESAIKNINCTDDEFKCYMPLLVFHIRNDYHGIISEFLISRCIKSFMLLNAFYYELHMYPNTDPMYEQYASVIKRLKKLLSTEQHEKILVRLLQGSSLLNTLEKVEKVAVSICDGDKSFEEIKDQFVLKNCLPLPLDPEKRVRSVMLNKIKVKNSATKPVMIPLELDDGSTYNIMYKREDVRKDQMVMNLIQLIDIILKREEDFDCYLTKYNILPLNRQSGLIQIVDNCDTIYYIEKKIQSSILNYIMERNPELTVGQLRDRYINSTAAYCVITYLLGVGDRHLDNMMVKRDGTMFHIDFGYILGKDPVFNNPGIRITDNIVEALGGLSSVYYQRFKDNCTLIYNCLRRNIDIFMNMLLILPEISELKLTEDEIKQQILKRFIPGENSIDAQFHLVNQLEQSSWLEEAKDWAHMHSKEKTISSSMSRLSSAITGFWVPPPPPKKPTFDE
jgi:hypothetical protein